MAISPAHAGATCDKVIISGDPSYPPLSWYDGSVMRGAALDIVTAAFDRMNQPYQIHFVGPFLRLLNEAKLGNVDVITELKNTPERQEFLAFAATPIFVNPVAAFVKKDAKIAYDTWNDLIGLKGGKTLGNKFGGGFDEYLAKNLTVEEVREIGLNFDMLAAGRIDYFVNSYYPALTYLMKEGLEGEFIALQPFVTANDNFVGWSKKSSCLHLLEKFDSVVAAMAQSGEIAKILSDNLDSYRTDPLQPGL